MMRNDIKQKIFNSRYCISLPKEQRDFFEKITNFYKEIYDILEFDENVKVLLCYSYNIKANTIFNNYTNTKYIILDMHLFDYFIDFFMPIVMVKNIVEDIYISTYQRFM